MSLKGTIRCNCIIHDNHPNCRDFFSGIQDPGVCFAQGDYITRFVSHSIMGYLRSIQVYCWQWKDLHRLGNVTSRVTKWPFHWGENHGKPIGQFRGTRRQRCQHEMARCPTVCRRNRSVGVWEPHLLHGTFWWCEVIVKFWSNMFWLWIRTFF